MPASRKQFCSKGHDTAVCGRSSGGSCKRCSADAARVKTLAKYGLTVEDYEKRLAEQGGVCAMCGRPPKKQRLHVDHDHEVEKREGRMLVRGLLCYVCNNKILGVMERFKVDPLRLAVYIFKARGTAFGDIARSGMFERVRQGE